jgi:hypothetical protein
MPMLHLPFEDEPPAVDVPLPLPQAAKAREAATATIADLRPDHDVERFIAPPGAFKRIPVKDYRLL